MTTAIAREAARRKNGEFGTQEHALPSRSLNSLEVYREKAAKANEELAILEDAEVARLIRDAVPEAEMVVMDYPESDDEIGWVSRVETSDGELDEDTDEIQAVRAIVGSVASEGFYDRWEGRETDLVASIEKADVMLGAAGETTTVGNVHWEQSIDSWAGEANGYYLDITPAFSRAPESATHEYEVEDVQTGAKFKGAAVGRAAAMESAVALSTWGTTEINPGSQTPVGVVDEPNHVAAGITFASTDSADAYKISPERNAHIPEEIRNSNGWYVGDEMDKVAFTFATDTHSDPLYGFSEGYRELGKKMSARYPDLYPF